MIGAVLAYEVVRLYALVFLSLTGSRVLLWLSDEEDAGRWLVRLVVVALVARVLGYV